MSQRRSLLVFVGCGLGFRVSVVWGGVLSAVVSSTLECLIEWRTKY